MSNKYEYKVPMENYTAIVRGIFEMIGRDKTSISTTPSTVSLSFNYKGADVLVSYKQFKRELLIVSDDDIPADLSQLVIHELERKKAVSPIPERKSVLDLENLTKDKPEKR